MVLRNAGIHAEYFTLLQPLPQPNNAEVSVFDGNVLLDHYLRFLPDYEHHLPGNLFEDWYLGRCARSRASYTRFRAVQLGKFLVPAHGKRCTAVVYAWSPNGSHLPKSILRPCSYSWHRRLHRFLVLCCSKSQIVCYGSSDNDSYESDGLHNLCPISMYATTATAPELRLPRLGPSRRCTISLDEWEIR